MYKTELMQVFEELDLINENDTVKKSTVSFYLYLPSNPAIERLLHQSSFTSEQEAKDFLNQIIKKTKKLIDGNQKVKACSKYEEQENSFTVEGVVRFNGPFWYTPMLPDERELLRNKGKSFLLGYKITLE